MHTKYVINCSEYFMAQIQTSLFIVKLLIMIKVTKETMLLNVLRAQAFKSPDSFTRDALGHISHIIVKFAISVYAGAPQSPLLASNCRHSQVKLPTRTSIFKHL